MNSLLYLGHKHVLSFGLRQVQQRKPLSSLWCQCFCLALGFSFPNNKFINFCLTFHYPWLSTFHSFLNYVHEKPCRFSGYAIAFDNLWTGMALVSGTHIEYDRKGFLYPELCLVKQHIGCLAVNTLTTIPLTWKVFFGPPAFGTRIALTQLYFCQIFQAYDIIFGWIQFFIAT